MGLFLKKNHEHVALQRSSVLITVIWTALCFLSAYWNIDTEKKKTLELAHKEALTVFNKDQAFRFWATDHEGVYVPINERTQPNEYLSHIPERDLLTPSGKQLTLMNPAYMLRQVMGHYASLYSTNSHITSLKTLNPINKPDAWEIDALQMFETGTEEVMEVSVIGEKQFLRLMKPMHTKVGCLKCHAHQGYKVGDVRGGVSVSIPLSAYREIEKNSIQKLYITHLFFFFSGFNVIVLIYYHNKQRIIEQKQAAAALQEESEKIKMFAYSVIHDLKNPVIAIHGLTNLLKKKYADVLDESGTHCCEKITDSAAQLDLLVGQLNEYISAKEHPLAIEELDLLEISRAVRAEFDNQLRERGIMWGEPAYIPTVRADAMAILRIMRNLVDNALKYGGDDLSRIDVLYKESEDFHSLCVVNDGNAIVADDYQKLFIQFKRDCTDGKVKGVGLGLAITKELVELHDGKVWGEPDVMKGTKFCFTISKKL
ncbi:DUF3365 domain-containing protein [Desulfopila sp. IMCC35008]|uniref:ATP-binding protein n=1 Tax=Desulfopila sp. IMCC35008 TaxID=2653858 RepID=UPI0013D7DBF6|nr:DUF3365 domain-containing protein [Desulfopila sp. IMCC35008]